MAFTPEDDTGLPGATSYISVEDATEYWADRNNGSAWADASEAEQQGALVEASAYLDATYDWVWANPPHWQGQANPLSPLEAYTPLKNADQGLQWPRNAAYDEETYVLQQGVPQKVKDATAHLALQALDGVLLDTRDRGGMVKREKLGTLEVEYMDNAPGGSSYPMVDRMLTGLHWHKGGTRKLRRT